MPHPRMTPAIWSMMAHKEDLPGALRYLHECGWGCFELSDEHLRWMQDTDDRLGRIEATRQVLSELNLAMPQAHGHLAANVAHRDERQRRAFMDILMADLDCCAQVGVKNVAIHPGVGDGYTTAEQRRELIRMNVENFRRLADRAGEHRLRIGIENLADGFSMPGGHMLGSSPPELLELIDAIDRPNVGVTIDTSHANIQQLDIPQAIRDFADRIFCTHISDNDGSSDQHLIPGIGRGRLIDWRAVMAAFADVNYEGIFNLEIPGARAREPKMLDRNARHALDIAQWLVDLG